MKYFGAAVSDVGIVKKTNQDSVCVKIAQTADKGQVAMVVMCDGMGGLEKGEFASAYVIETLSAWFEKELPSRLPAYSWDNLSREWVGMVTEMNQRLLDYGKTIHVNLGTTLSALLIIEEKYMIVHVGDSRIYKIKSKVEPLTEDQTFIHREISRGAMTLEQAKLDSRRNMLLQCVGASKVVEPEISFGEVPGESVFVLCSDGFWHVWEEQELYEALKPDCILEEKKTEKILTEMVETVKSRNEKDNITVIVLKCVG